MATLLRRPNAVLGQLVEQSSTTPRVSGSILSSSWLHFENSLDETQTLHHHG